MGCIKTFLEPGVVAGQPAVDSEMCWLAIHNLLQLTLIAPEIARIIDSSWLG